MRRVRACSYSRRRPSWLVKSSTESRPDWLDSMALRKRRVLWMLLAMAEYLALSSGSWTWPRPQSRDR
jgi:hypothetical protein